MDLYRRYCVRIWDDDRNKADDILTKHAYDIDNISVSSEKNSNGLNAIRYWITPYIYEDLEKIVNEFKEAGIQIV